MVTGAVLTVWLAWVQQKEDWDYAGAMKAVAAKFTGREGVVIHLGDSITYANPYGQWARGGKGKTERDVAILKWMHAGADDETDGWFLARVDREGGRSDTAVGGIRADEYLAGGRAGIPPLADVVKKYNPRMAIVMLGTNDASAGRPVEAYRADMVKIVEAILANRTIPILSTIPPHVGAPELARRYSEALRAIARERKIPLIDYEREILSRRPNDWDGTLMNKGDVHPSARRTGAEPTEANLRECGYLLRGWLSVRKVAEVKERVLP
jgi:lysophospholipase L1-like esterase